MAVRPLTWKPGPRGDLEDGGFRLKPRFTFFLESVHDTGDIAAAHAAAGTTQEEVNACCRASPGFALEYSRAPRSAEGIAGVRLISRVLNPPRRRNGKPAKVKAEDLIAAMELLWWPPEMPRQKPVKIDPKTRAALEECLELMARMERRGWVAGAEREFRGAVDKGEPAAPPPGHREGGNAVLSRRGGAERVRRGPWILESRTPDPAPEKLVRPKGPRTQVPGARDPGREPKRPQE
jgi:hypothetical protein